jgi:hypothetical protein
MMASLRTGGARSMPVLAMLPGAVTLVYGGPVMSEGDL